MTPVPTVETDVLIVGSGPAGGASAAPALTTYGVPNYDVPNVMVTRYSRLANKPPGAHHQPAHHGSAA